MKKFWDDYGWIIAIAVFAIITLRAFWGREAFCGPESEQCLREWVSATGGWVAVAVAIPTIFYLDKQARIANKANSNNAKILLRRTQAIARRAHLEANLSISTANVCLNTSNAWKTGGTSVEEARYMMLDMLGTLADSVAPAIFDKFEEEIEIPWHGVAQAREMIEKFRLQIASSTDASVERAALNEQQFATSCHIVIDYCQSCSSIASELFYDAQTMTHDV